MSCFKAGAVYVSGPPRVHPRVTYNKFLEDCLPPAPQVIDSTCTALDICSTQLESTITLTSGGKMQSTFDNFAGFGHICQYSW